MPDSSITDLLPLIRHQTLRWLSAQVRLISTIPGHAHSYGMDVRSPSSKLIYPFPEIRLAPTAYGGRRRTFESLAESRGACSRAVECPPWDCCKRELDATRSTWWVLSHPRRHALTHFVSQTRARVRRDASETYETSLGNARRRSCFTRAMRRQQCLADPTFGPLLRAYPCPLRPFCASYGPSVSS